jgi:poly-gamma-glutamate synthesis protein (capsule biosynthesis protein)
MKEQEFLNNLFLKGFHIFHEKKQENLVTISCAGDFSPQLGIRERLDKGLAESSISNEVKDAVKADMAIANLECAVTDNAKALTTRGSGIRCYKRDLLLFKNIGFNVAVIANNHIYDYGHKGLMDTLKNLKELNIPFVGAGMNLHEARKSLIITAKNGLRIGINAYAQLDGDGAANKKSGVAPMRYDYILENLSNLKKQSDISILVLHEGYEMIRLPRPNFIRLCRKLANEGADIIFAHHPHVPNGLELYNSTPIFYSLGNFYMDWDYHRLYPQTRWSLIPRLTYEGTSLHKIEVTPIIMNNDFTLTLPIGKKWKELMSYYKKISIELTKDDLINQCNKEAAQNLLTFLLKVYFVEGQKNNKEIFKKLEYGFRSNSDLLIKIMLDFSRNYIRENSIDEDLF